MTLNQTRRACICLMLFAAMWHRDFVFAATLHCDFLPVTKTQERSRLRHAKARHQGAALCGCCCLWQRCHSLFRSVFILTVSFPAHIRFWFKQWFSRCIKSSVRFCTWLPLLPEGLWNLC